MSRVPRLFRLMHTGARQSVHPGQAGVPTNSTSPLPHGHLESNPSLSPRNLDPNALSPSLDGSVPAALGRSSSRIRSRPQDASPPLPQRWTPKGKPIPYRPPRTVPVRLPSGDLPPPSYPPPISYLNGLDSDRKPSHPLWQFFHVPAEARAPPNAKWDKPPVDLGSLESLAVEEANLRSGRSWNASELRTKSFADLHTLWYLLVRERNVLATQREERTRLGVPSTPADGKDLIKKRAFRCRKSMARIKYILNERRLGLIAANTPPSELSPAAARVLQVANKPASRKGAVAGAFLEGPAAGEADGEEGTEGITAESIAEPEEVAQEEVKARDEGWGGGEEAKEFVQHVKVGEDGHVEKK